MNNQQQPVYRVQDSQGRGPFRPGLAHRWVDESKDFEALPPWTDVMSWEDQGRFLSECSMGRFGGCGCERIEDLRLWFTPTEFERLLRLGFQAVKMEARIIGRVSNQCIFVRRQPLNIDAHPLVLWEPK